MRKKREFVEGAFYHELHGERLILEIEPCSFFLTIYQKRNIIIKEFMYVQCGIL